MLLAGAVQGAGKFLNKIPIMGNILTIVAAYAICGPGGSICAAAVSSLTSAFVAGVRSGSLGQALRAGLTSAATAAAMFGVGEITGHGNLGFGTGDHIANIAGHAGAGCLSAMASGGKCGQGAAAAAAGAFAGPLVAEMGLSYEGRLVANSVVGGLASVAGGGKFGDGAVTAAFGYMFNEAGTLSDEDNGRAPAGYEDGTWCNAGPRRCCNENNLSDDSINDTLGWLDDLAEGYVESRLLRGRGASGTLGVHGNSSQSQRRTEVYHLIDLGSGEIAKIGIYSPRIDARYTPVYLRGHNVRYEVVTTYQSRYPAMVHEQIELTFYKYNHGSYPSRSLKNPTADGVLRI
jgi:hypothetical protein